MKFENKFTMFYTILQLKFVTRKNVLFYNNFSIQNFGLKITFCPNWPIMDENVGEKWWFLAKSKFFSEKYNGCNFGQKLKFSLRIEIFKKKSLNLSPNLTFGQTFWGQIIICAKKIGNYWFPYP